MLKHYFVKPLTPILVKKKTSVDREFRYAFSACTSDLKTLATETL